MAIQRVPWFIVAACCLPGLGCGHSRSNQCSQPPRTAYAPDRSSNLNNPDPVPLTRQYTPFDSPKEPAPPRVLAPDIAIVVPDPAPKKVIKPVIEKAPKNLEKAIVELAPPPRVKPSIETGRFGHSLDFAWIVGELQYVHGSKQWRIRYLPSETDDPFGGVVTIVGAEHLANQFKEGAKVKLQGQLVDPDARTAAPGYYTYGIKVLD
jgi:hypothetical protein